MRTDNGSKLDSIVIGGGFFGCSLALALKRELRQNVLILERAGNLLERASFRNQARVHAGYHYPRSFLTALRSQANFSRFVDDYGDCIVSDFNSYYAIGKHFSKVTASQFEIFSKRIGAQLTPAPAEITEQFNPQLIESVYTVKEFAFDAVKLRDQMIREIEHYDIGVLLNAEVLRVGKEKNARFRVEFNEPHGTTEINCTNVFNCTYSGINHLLVESGLEPIPLKHELTEMALIEVPPELENVGVTVMCGPFFSVMPFPPRNLHSLSHVRYTPHYEWHTDTANFQDPEEVFRKWKRESNYDRMLKDAQRFIPKLSESKYVDSLWEIKTVLPKSEVDDGRPILLKQDYGWRNHSCIMGAKVDNVYDVLDYFINKG